MSTYIVGDIHGQYDKLLNLLHKVAFDKTKDKLYSVGDILARGQDSLAVIEYLMSLGDSFDMVLGNHEINFLAIYFGIRQAVPFDKLTNVLASPKLDAIINFLLQKKFLLQEDHTQALIVHAGILPTWTIQEACQYAAQLHAALISNPQQFLRDIFNKKSISQERMLTDIFTRMRYCYINNGTIKLDLHTKTSIQHAPCNLYPWFSLANRTTTKIFFGHWASLGVQNSFAPFYALDGGCVWGGDLYMYCVEDKVYIK